MSTDESEPPPLAAHPAIFVEGGAVLALVATIVVGTVVAVRQDATPHLLILIAWFPATVLGVHLLITSRHTLLSRAVRSWCRWTGWAGALALLWLFLASLLTGLASR
jgi:hypothetical protein